MELVSEDNLDAVHAYRESVMLRRGRETAKGIVAVEKGPGNFLTDRRCCLCIKGQHASSAAVPRKGYDPRGIDKSVPRGQVSVPYRKKRDSLAILKALASTVGTDENSAQYQLADDPLLMPQRMMEKKSALLSMAAGQRAARHFVNEYRAAFDHDAAVPHIPAFQPVDTAYVYTTPGEDALKERIERRRVIHAIEVYDKMKQQGLEVSAQTQLLLLELLCVYNCMDPDEDMRQIERMYDEVGIADPEEKKYWKDLNKAEEVFDELEEKTEDAYNWLVRGMLKKKNLRGHEVYQEMLDKSIPVEETYFSELKKNWTPKPHSRSGRFDEESLKTYKGVLVKMEAEGLSPTRETFHAALMGLLTRYSTMYTQRVPSILAEMKAMGIEPTLVTWGIVVKVLRKLKPNTGPDSTRRVDSVGSEIIEIVNHLRQREGDVEVDTDDFFLIAMRACEDSHDAELALKVHALKTDLRHQYVVNSVYKENKYHLALLSTLCKTETCDTVMEVYSQICPQKDLLSEPVIVDILGVVEVYQEYHHLLELWQNFSLDFFFMQAGKAQTKFFRLMARKGHTEELKDAFAIIAKLVYTKWLSSLDFRRPNYMDGRLLGSLIQVLLYNNDLKQAWSCFMTYSEKTDSLTGDIMNDVLKDLFVSCIDQEDVEKITSFASIYPSISHETLSWTVEDRREDLERILSPQDMKLVDKL